LKATLFALPFPLSLRKIFFPHCPLPLPLPQKTFSRCHCPSFKVYPCRCRFSTFSCRFPKKLENVIWKTISWSIKNSNARRFLNHYALKWSALENNLGDQFLNRSLGPCKKHHPTWFCSHFWQFLPENNRYLYHLVEEWSSTFPSRRDAKNHIFRLNFSPN